MQIKVAVAGAGGRMGQEVCQAVLEAQGMELTALVDPRFSGRTLGSVLRMTSGDSSKDPPKELDLIIQGDIEALSSGGVDVVVDFTQAEAFRSNVATYASNNIHAVVGTTGLNELDVTEITRLFDMSDANAIVAANFAIGAVLLMRMAEMAAPYMEGAEVIELHHSAKRDAPSGTAIHTAERIADARKAAGLAEFPKDMSTSIQFDGARGAQLPGQVRVHSVRLAGLIAHEEVIFGASGQSLTIRHDSYDRRSFMPGVLLAIRAVSDCPGVTIGLDSLLGI